MLLTAYRIEFYDFYQFGIIEISYIRIIESNMPVFSDTQANNVYRIFSKQIGISFAFLFKTLCASIQVVHFFKRNFVKDTNTEEMPETLWRVRMNTYVFIHMEGVDSGPIYSLIMD